MTLLTECGFCESLVVDINEFGFCKMCEQAFKVLTADEIRAIQNKTGFKRQTPDKEDYRASEKKE
jgi:hypothetical protein